MKYFLSTIIFLSLTTLLQASDLPGACRHFLDKVKPALNGDSLEQAIIYADKAISCAKTREDSSEYMSRVGEYFYRVGEYQYAFSYTGKAIDLGVDSLYATAKAYYYRARAIFEMKNPKLNRVMRKDLEKAVQLIDAFGYKDKNYIKPYSLLKIAQYYTKIGDTDRAITYLNRALVIGQTPAMRNNPYITIEEDCLIELGIAYATKGDATAAINYYQKALTVPGIHEYYFEIIYDRLSEVYTSIGNYPEAIRYRDLLINLYEQFEYPEGILAGKIYKASIYESMGQHVNARKLLSEAGDFENLLNKAGLEPRELGKIHLKAADIYSQSKDFDASLNHYHKALEVVIKDSLLDDPRSQPSLHMIYPENVLQDGLNGKGNVFLNRYGEEGNIDDLHSAFSSYSLAMLVDDALRKEFGGTSSKKILATETHWRTELVLQAAELLEKEGNSMTDTVFAMMEHSRALDLYGTLKEANALVEEGLPEELMDLRDEMKFSLSECNASWVGSQSIAMDSACASFQYQYDSLQRVLEERFPSYRINKYKLDFLHLKKVQNYLSSKQAIVEYFWGEKSLYGLLITADRAKWMRLGDTGEVSELLLELNLQIPSSDLQTASALAKLYASLVKPFGELPSSLIIVPDGQLHSLPFEPLLMESPDSEVISAIGANFWKGNRRVEQGADYLLYEHSIQYAHSATLLFTKNSDVSAAKSIAVFAPEYSDQDSFQHYLLTPLTGSVDHAYRLADMLDGKAFIGREATEKVFFQKVEKYRVLHLALHGFANQNDPLLASLAFNSEENHDGMVNAAKLYGLPPLHAELVSLLSCETGSGPYAKGEGILSLARAFRYAGANSVVMSLWQADVVPGIQIMENFFQYLDQGLDKSSALQQAKLDWLAHAGMLEVSPARWANFVIVGNERPLELNNSIPFYAYFLGVLIILTILSVWVYHKRRLSRS